MKRLRPKFLRYFVLLLAIAGSGALLLYTSQSVQRQEDELAKIQRSAERERQMINVLEAEWARLNSPYNLEDLTERYLDLVPPDTMAITPEVPEFQAQDIAADILDGEDADLKIDVVAPEPVIRPAKKPSYSPPRKKIPLKAAPKKQEEESGINDLLGRLQRGGES